MEHKKALTEEEVDLLVGFVISKNHLFQEVHPWTAAKFVRNAFNKNLSTSSVTTYLHKAGLVNRTAKRENTEAEDSIEARLDLYLTWIQDARKKSFFTIRPCFLCSVDFTYTSHRTMRICTYSAKGGYDNFFFDFSV
eukprot:TRINITY_DN2790_c1_g1_i1.p1 TRINITY_DN2790_c1_g1~~TRINITY_DN2790_c1_g1_i1.p1  ORF type:complete len:137 (+),score=20.20 TRINITY_DN2790_c1_g1_i1:535-945(+)